MKVLVGAAVAVLLWTGFGGIAPVATAKTPGTVVSGLVLNQDTVWTTAGSPYTVRQPVQIPYGVTLTVEPGVRIIGDRASHFFKVAGDLRILGSADRPVSIDGRRATAIFESATKHDAPGLVEIRYADIQNARSIMPAGGDGSYIQFILADSAITNVREYSYVWYPLPESAILRNTFSRSGGFSIGASVPSGETESPITVEGNRFLTKSTTGYWIQNWNGRDAALPVHGNSFMVPGVPSVTLRDGYDSSAIDARGNYWGTTDPAVIDKMILDSRDDISRASVIEYEPILRKAPWGPPSTTPSEPLDVAASVSAQGVTVSWQSPLDTGGRGDLIYTATADPGPGSCTVTKTRSCSIAGLPAGEHTFTVTARNGAGTSSPSIPSAPVIPGSSTPTPDPSPSPSPTPTPTPTPTPAPAPSPGPDTALATVSLGAIQASTTGRWVNPTGCGSYLVRISGVTRDDIGTLALVDAASGKTLASELFLAEQPGPVHSMQVCASDTSASARLALTLDFSDSGVARSPAFTWERNPAPLASPTSLPARVDSGRISARTADAWVAPASGCASYRYSASGITSDDIGAIKLIDASTRQVLNSEVYLGRPGNGEGDFMVCASNTRADARLLLQLDFSDGGVYESAPFRWQQSAPASPSATTLPATVSLGGASVTTRGDWRRPSACRNYEFAYSGLPDDAVGSVRLIHATSRVILGSEVLINSGTAGTADFQVCSSGVTATTPLRLQVSVAGLGLAESSAFRFQ